jgi:hypothetical protein
MPRYKLPNVELDGLKKPKAKAPPSETMVVPGESCLPGTSWSSDALNGSKFRRVSTAVEQARAFQSIDRSAQTLGKDELGY